jgi:hypothetical protein
MNLRYEVLRALNMSIVVFLVVAPYLATRFTLKMEVIGSSEMLVTT